MSQYPRHQEIVDDEAILLIAHLEHQVKELERLKGEMALAAASLKTYYERLWLRLARLYPDVQTAQSGGVAYVTDQHGQLQYVSWDRPGPYDSGGRA